MKWFLPLISILCLNACIFNPSNSYNTRDVSYINNTPSAIEKAKTSLREEYLTAYENTLSLWPVPYREITLETSLGNAHIIISGPVDAPPVILLHGMNASSTMWYPNIEELSKNYRVYAIDDLTEPGKSERNRRINNMQEVISWYLEILDNLELKNFTLIGASKGGWLAVNLATIIPHRVDKLILLSPLQTFGPIPPGMKVFSLIRYALHPNRKKLDALLESMSTHTGNIDSLFIEQLYLATKMADEDHLLLSFSPIDRKDLKKLQMPVLVMIGDEDIINKNASVKRAKELIPHTEASVIPDAGHFLTMDQPEVINDRILDFINSSYISGSVSFP